MLHYYNMIVIVWGVKMKVSAYNIYFIYLPWVTKIWPIEKIQS